MSVNKTNILDLGVGAALITDTVYVDQLDPNTAGAIFSPNKPSDSQVLYVSEVDGSTWIWDGTKYINEVQTINIDRVGDCARMTVTTARVVSNPTLQNNYGWDTISYTYGSTCIALPSSGVFKLSAGYRYRLDFTTNGSYNAVGSYAVNGVFRSSTIGSGYVSTGWVVTPLSTSATYSQSTEPFESIEISATVDTFVTVAVAVAGSGTTSIVGDPGLCSFSCQNIGVL